MKIEQPHRSHTRERIVFQEHSNGFFQPFRVHARTHRVVPHLSWRNCLCCFINATQCLNAIKSLTYPSGWVIFLSLHKMHKCFVFNSNGLKKQFLCYYDVWIHEELLSSFFSTILLTSNRKKAFKWRDQHTEYNSFVFDGIVIEVTKTYLLCSSLSVLRRSNICSALFHSSFVEHMEF